MIVDKLHWYHWLMLIFTYVLAPGWIGFVTAFPRSFGPFYSVTMCACVILFLLMGAAIKYWYG